MCLLAAGTPAAGFFSRERASAWFSGEDARKGALRVGEYADLAVLSHDYFAVPGAAIKDITSLLTNVDGKIELGAGAFGSLASPLPPPSSDWSPMKTYGGYHRAKTDTAVPVQRAAACGDGCVHGCAVHGHAHAAAAPGAVATADLTAFWGVLGCSCFAF